MTWHAIGKSTENGKMQHLVHGKAWKKFDTRYPDFVAEPRNVRLGLAADGFNPFETSLILALLIPGPKSLGKDIDVYLRPLIYDLKDLWALKGVDTIDIATGKTFNMRAILL
ncbi:CACTA transposable element [Tanacetum coccineum]